MTSADVTRRELSLGAADSITGWYAKSFSNSTIKMIIRPKGSSLPGGLYAKYDLTGFTPDYIVEGDEIIDTNSTYYSVDTTETEDWLDSFSHYVCKLTKIDPHADRPTTYGTEGSVHDPRERMHTFLNTYWTDGNVLKDDGVTTASGAFCWSGYDYPMGRVFVDKAVDYVLEIGEVKTVALIGYNHSAYGYQETTPITVHTINKSGITGENLRQQVETELRSVLENNAIGSETARIIDESAPETIHYGGRGGIWVYRQKYSVVYRRDIT